MIRALLLFLAGTPVFAAMQEASTDVAFKPAVFEDLQGEFRQSKALKALDVEIKTEGRFRVIRLGSGKHVVHWRIEKPKPSTVCLDPEGIVLESATGGKKSLRMAEIGREVGEQMGSLFGLLGLEPDQVQKDFQVRKKGAGFLLTPKDSEKFFFETVELELDSVGLVKRMILTEKNKDEMRLSFVKLKMQKIGPKTETACAR
ncbi:MAG TPA: outer membrane lipoprotein carrier protein LolA [Pseudobdellovibrionaceae bacterium]|nr:outer membrane lipoprotein carrier protein LolA [Pseudobdellovibrionaceae bacterium]